eukprot:2606651-Alexandrium_andersonii.AAC.1
MHVDNTSNTWDWPPTRGGAWKEADLQWQQAGLLLSVLSEGPNLRPIQLPPNADSWHELATRQCP